MNALTKTIQAREDLNTLSREESRMTHLGWIDVKCRDYSSCIPNIDPEVWILNIVELRIALFITISNHKD